MAPKRERRFCQFSLQQVVKELLYSVSIWCRHFSRMEVYSRDLFWELQRISRSTRPNFQAAEGSTRWKRGVVIKQNGQSLHSALRILLIALQQILTVMHIKPSANISQTWCPMRYKRNTSSKKQQLLIQANNIMNQPKKAQTPPKAATKLPQQQRLPLLQAFLSRNKPSLSKGVTIDNTRVTVVPDSNQYLPVLGEMLRNGQLVGFPTETVYGLGADATNEAALLEIYRVKRRPLTDPIIVHVLDFQSALKLVLPSSQQELELFKKLTQQFWPGPLTVILKANLDILPKVVTAQTGFVGLRSPRSNYARKLIEASSRPIGAPSANLFSHVSPTSAVHVLNDFHDQDIAVVDGSRCEFGVESTVVKINDNVLEILREGSLSTKKLKEFVDRTFGQKVRVVLKKRVQKQEENKNMQAPGQLLKHYAPYLPCFTASFEDLVQFKNQYLKLNNNETLIDLGQTILISFSSRFEVFKDKFKVYLSSDGVKEEELQIEENQEDQKFCTLEEKNKMRSLYFLLRKAENIDARAIIIGWNEDRQGTLWDKIFRSTQGQNAVFF